MAPPLHPVDMLSMYDLAGALALDGILVSVLSHEDVHLDVFIPVGFHLSEQVD